MTNETAPVASQATAFGTLVNIITNPGQAMQDIEDRNKWLWLPLILTVVIAMVSSVMYFTTVDMDWFVDQIMAASPEEIPAEAREIMKSSMLIGGLVGILIMVPVIYLIYSVFLMLTDKFVGSRGYEFGDWFSLTVWGHFPTILGTIASIVYIAVAGSPQMSPDEVSFFTLNALVTHYPMGHPAQGWAQAISPFMLWAIYVIGIGVSQRTGKSTGAGIAIAAAPYVVIFGLWGLAVTGG